MSLILFGVLLIISINNFFIWIGRKKDLRCLSLIFLSLTYMLMLYFYRIKPVSINFVPIMSSIIGFCFSFSFTFFSLTIFKLQKLKKYFTVCLIIIAVFSTISSIYYLLTNNLIMLYFYYISLFIYSFSSIILTLIFIMKYELYKERLAKYFLFWHLTVAVSLSYILINRVINMIKAIRETVDNSKFILYFNK
jgi:hypothetical protein